MQAMVLARPGEPLALTERPDPMPSSGEVRVRVAACGVCRTDLHVVDGDLPRAKLPIIPGHEIVGRIDALGPDATGLQVGMRVGVPWLGRTCGTCRYCQAGQENLCDRPLFTGYTRDGGYATLCCGRRSLQLRAARGRRRYCDGSAPLRRSDRVAVAAHGGRGPADRALWLRGPAHIVAAVARWQGREVFAFTRSGDADAQAFARKRGASWAGSSEELPPEPLDCAIIFAPVGALVPAALMAVRKGGRVVCAGIHMSPIPSFPYNLLWEERELVSVANLTRRDGIEFFDFVPKASIVTETKAYPLRQANEAMSDLRAGRLQGAAVLVP